MTDVLALRIALCAHGYIPVPLFGKVPPAYGKNNQRKGMQNWQLLDNVTREQLEMWGKTWPDAINTGILTKRTPTFDADILSEEAARATEDFVRARVEQRGFVLVRRGLWPKFCIPFRTDNPFKKIVANIISPHGRTEKIEFLGDGQQVVAEGIHPDTGKPYTWFGGEPWSVAHDDLPSISEDEARQLVNDVVEMLCRDFGYAREAGRPKHNGGKAAAAGSAADRGGADDWQYLYDNILKGNALHDSLRDLAAKLIASGTSPGAAVNQLRALMEASTAPTDERWKERHADIPRLVDSAVAKFRTQDEKQAAQDEKPAAAPVGPPLPIDEIIKVFERWLLLKDYTPLYAVLGTVAANYLEGDPVWLGVIGPPSSAKTEFLNATSMLPHVAQAATLTQAALLSGTPKKQQAAGAKGGLLRQIGDFGIIILKDFGSILSMHTETRAEVLAALREIYDGAWTRYLGSEGGKKLEWKGKLGLIFAGTGVIDAHYAVIGAMGDRFLLSRLAPTPGQTQFRRALGHTGSTTKQMRKELAEAVARLFAGRRDQPQPISNEEANSIGEVISLAVRLRGAVERDRTPSMVPRAPPVSGSPSSACWPVWIPSGSNGRRHLRSSKPWRSIPCRHCAAPPMRPSTSTGT